MTGWLMMAMVAILTIDIIWRIFGKPLLGLAELSVFVMMAVVYLGFAGCEEHNQHVRLEILESMLSPRASHVLRKVVQILAAITVVIFFIAVFRDASRAYITNDSIEGKISLPLWPTKFIMVAGMTVYLLQVVTGLFSGPGRDTDGSGSSGVEF